MQGRLDEYVVDAFVSELTSIKIDLLNLTEQTSALLVKLMQEYNNDHYFEARVHYTVRTENETSIACVLSHDLLQRLTNPTGKHPRQVRCEVLASDKKILANGEVERDVIATLAANENGSFTKKVKDENEKRVVHIANNFDAKGERRKSLQLRCDALRRQPEKHAKPPTFFARQCYIVMRREQAAAPGIEDQQPLTPSMLAT